VTARNWPDVRAEAVAAGLVNEERVAAGTAALREANRAYAQRQTYTVNAVRAGDWWSLTVPDAPGAVSQVRDLDSAEEYAREAISFVTGAEPDTFGVVVVALEGEEPGAETTHPSRHGHE